jgi:hypothetical protein
MIDEEVLRMERAFWTGGADHYRDAIDPACVMAFPAPAGILTGPEIVRSLADAPRWASVGMTEARVSRPAPDLLVLAYRAEGRREGAPPYAAFCTSTYYRFNGCWRLVQHQQTPV